MNKAHSYPRRTHYSMKEKRHDIRQVIKCDKCHNREYNICVTNIIANAVLKLRTVFFSLSQIYLHWLYLV